MPLLNNQVLCFIMAANGHPINIIVTNVGTTNVNEWKTAIANYVNILLTPPENPPMFIIFFQEGSEEKDEFLRHKMGNYAILCTDEGSKKTNGLIFHRSFNFKKATETIKMELQFLEPYFFVFDSHRFHLEIYSYEEDKMKCLLVSHHGHNIEKGLDDKQKVKNTEYYLIFFDKVRDAHGCQSMIIAGDFNIKYSAIQEKCEDLLNQLDLDVMEYKLTTGHHRYRDPQKKPGRGKPVEVVDTVIHSKSVAVVGNIDIDKDIPKDVMDHHIIRVTLFLPCLHLPNQADEIDVEIKKELGTKPKMPAPEKSEREKSKEKLATGELGTKPKMPASEKCEKEKSKETPKTGEESAEPETLASGKIEREKSNKTPTTVELGAKPKTPTTGELGTKPEMPAYEKIGKEKFKKTPTTVELGAKPKTPTTRELGTKPKMPASEKIGKEKFKKTPTTGVVGTEPKKPSSEKGEKEKIKKT